MKVLKVEDDPTARQILHIKILKYSPSPVKHNDDDHIRRHITDDRSLGTVGPRGLGASMNHPGGPAWSFYSY